MRAPYKTQKVRDIASLKVISIITLQNSSVILSVLKCIQNVHVHQSV